MAAVTGKRGAARRNPAARRRVSFWGVLRTFLGYVTLIVLLSVVIGLGYMVRLFYTVARDLPQPDMLISYTPGGVTEIYATDKEAKTGREILLGRVFHQRREFLPITKIPDVVQDATISVEDERFFQHPGVDVRGLARAVYTNFRSGRLLDGQGGSTLTQQLARNIYLSQKKTLSRKAQEMMLAIQLERNFSKEEILEMYLNEVYYGSNAYGIQAAAKVYFNRDAQKLSLSQAALLAGLPQRPSEYDPYKNKDEAIRRRNVVLAKMAEQGYIKPDAATVAQSNGVFLAEKPKNQFQFKAPYFTNYVIRQLIERYGEEMVYKGGLKVYTTLNWQMQQAAERALRDGVGDRSSITEGALVCVEPRSGYVRAMVGGVDFDKNQYNNVVQGRRQPGSAFKPIVYATAFDTGNFDPSSIVVDAPYRIGSYSPKNYGGSYHGAVTIRTALTYSYNIPAVKIAKQVGLRRVIATARKMGITSPLQPYPSLALGSYEVSPLEIVMAYSVFANRGNRVLPMTIIRVRDHENNLLENNAPQVERAVIGESTADQIGDVLQDVVQRGTARAASGVPHAHGKTGTTNDYKDAWFVGYTPELTAAVWVCNLRKAKKGSQVKDVYLAMAQATGGQVCAPIWSRFMKVAVPIQQNSGLKIPQPVKANLAKLLTGKSDEAERPEALPNPDTYIPRAVKRGDAQSAAAAAQNTPGPAAQSDDSAAGAASNIPTAPRPIVASASIAAASIASTSAIDARSARNNLPAARDAGLLVSARPVAASPAAAAPAVAAAATPAPAAAAAVSAPVPIPERARPAPPRPPVRAAPPAAPRLISVTICPDSGARATRWCPETMTREFAASRAPRGYCRIHKPRPGDG